METNELAIIPVIPMSVTKLTILDESLIE